MGREVRKVPANWDHPKMVDYGDGRLQPMFDDRFETAVANWKTEFAKWENGERPDYCNDESKTLEFWEWDGGPPDRAYYRPWKDEDATWLQIWETVSEGTPVTPPFATAVELVDYLAAHGDFWDQKRGDGPWDRANAEKFVNDRWAPSFMVIDSQIIAPRDGGIPTSIT